MRRLFPLLLALLAAVSCTRRESVHDERPARVIVISIDTLRSDHLPAYGYARGSTPAIDALRADSLLFERAFSTVPLTLPSHATIFTGLLPAEHGVLDNVGYTLPANVETMASRLKREGFATGAAVSSYVLRRETGIASGFDFYDDAMDVAAAGADTSATRDGSKTTEALEQWIASSGGERFFAFLHLYEPHTPYRPPAQFANAATPYDGEISYADAIVGRFVAFLKQRNLYDDSLIVLLSDHGEGLGEHGEKEHGIFVYRESLQVPLLIKLPKQSQRGQASARLVSLTDVWPSIASQASLDVGKLASLDTFRTPVPKERMLYAESFFARLHFGWHEQRSMLGERHHYIDSAKPELFDWVADRGETKNVLADERRVAAAMRGALPPVTFKTPSAVSEEDRRALESLGYLASSSRTSGPAPDPKEKIATLQFYDDGRAQLRRGEFAAAAQNLRKFVDANPDMSDGWVALAQAQARSGQDDAAMASLRVAMTKFPESPIVVLSMASALFERGQLDDAERHVRLVVDTDPVPAHELLAAMAEKKGDVAKAQEHLAEVLKRAPANVAALTRQARLHARGGRHADAVALFDRAATAGGASRNLQFDRAQSLLQAGRVPDAEAAFRSEVAAFPDNLQAWANLAVVQYAQRKREPALASLEEAIRRNPGPQARRMAAEVLATVGDREALRRLDGAR